MRPGGSGAPWDDDPRTGSAYVYSTDLSWISPVLYPFVKEGASTVYNENAGRNFGVGGSVISEEFYVVGTLTGQIYSFRERVPDWDRFLGPIAPAELPEAKMGASVAVHGTTTAVGAPDFDGRGAVFVYEGTLTSSSVPVNLQPGAANLNDQFGVSVAISGDLLVAGAPGYGSGRGGVYTFQRIGDVWTQLGDPLNYSGDVGIWCHRRPGCRLADRRRARSGGSLVLRVQRSGVEFRQQMDSQWNAVWGRRCP